MTTDQADSGTRPISEKQLQANRRNGPKSHGPTTEAGLKRCRDSRVVHGGWADSLYPIEQGLFKEDPFDFEERVNGLIDGMRPRDPLEYVAAQNVALCFVRLARVARMEVAEAAGEQLSMTEHQFLIDPDRMLALLAKEANPASPETPGEADDESPWTGTVEDVQDLRFQVGCLIHLLEHPQIADGIVAEGWENFTWCIWDLRGHREVIVPGLFNPREGLTPQDRAGWRQTFWKLFRQFFPTDQDAIQWMQSPACQGQIYRRAKQSGAALAVIAERIMDGSMTRAARLRAAINRELLIYLEVYGRLRQRADQDLPDDPDS